MLQLAKFLATHRLPHTLPLPAGFDAPDWWGTPDYHFKLQDYECASGPFTRGKRFWALYLRGQTWKFRGQYEVTIQQYVVVFGKFHRDAENRLTYEFEKEMIATSDDDPNVDQEIRRWVKPRADDIAD